jgi:hypothetical protein
MGREEVYKLCHRYSLELLFIGLGNEGSDVIETVLIIFGLGFLGITLAISVICFMVWLALNES